MSLQDRGEGSSSVDTRVSGGKKKLASSLHALPATALLVQFGNSFLYYTVSCLVEARDSISLHLEKEKSLFHFKEKLNFLHLLNFLFIEQHHHLSGCPHWTDTQQSSQSLSLHPASKPCRGSLSEHFPKWNLPLLSLQVLGVLPHRISPGLSQQLPK